jgi:hypothetical protein
MNSKIILASSTRVFQRLRLSSSICIEDQNDSIIALSRPPPTLPNDGRRPAERIRSPKTQEVSLDGAPGSPPVVDVVLPQPLGQRDGMDAKLHRCQFGLLAGADQRDGARARNSGGQGRGMTDGVP